jgi:hypothetical protein
MIPEIRLPPFLNDMSKADYTLKRMIRGYLPEAEVISPVIKSFFPLIVCASDYFLTPEELVDIRNSIDDIRDGKIEKFSEPSYLIKWLES